MRSLSIRRRLGAIVAALLFVGCADPPPALRTPDLSSMRNPPAGTLIGARGSYGDQVWLGIPFARAPIGPLRWRAPLKLPRWNGILEATSFGAPCVQYASTFAGVPGKEGEVVGDEDCLFLNVYAPTFAADEVPAGRERLPVMVWIHGGGNSIGEAGFYDGGRLAAEQRVIVVTTNYRLGPFGWLRHAALREGATEEEQSGNFGTLDLVAALRWVRDNVAAFGGDPDNVTIFGESAGGRNVFSLLLLPRAKGLFQRAITQSGGLNFDSLSEAEHFTDDPDPGAPASSNETLVRLLVADGSAANRAAAKQKLAAMSPEEVAAYLREKPARAVIASYRPQPGNGLIWMPQVFADGVVLQTGNGQAPFSSAASWNSVPVMMGTNRDENRTFMFGDPESVTYRLWILPRLKDERMYLLVSEYLAKMWKATAADMPADSMRADRDDVYVYRFDWDEEPTILGADLSIMLGAAHGFEIPFVFGHFDLGKRGNVIFTDDNAPGREKLSAAMRGYWAEFARTGKPGRGGTPDGVEWSAWSTAAAGPKYLVLDTAAGGGVRMESEALTVQSVLAQVAADPRLAAARDRCAVYAAMARWSRGFTKEEYESLPECKPFPLAG